MTCRITCRRGLALFLALITLFAAVTCWGGTVSLMVNVRDDGGVEVTANAAFSTCPDSGSGSVELYLDNAVYSSCLSRGVNSASCTYVYDRGILYGQHTFKGVEYDCTGSQRAYYTLQLDNTPTVNITAPSGTVSGPFDITGAATFKPTLDSTKGSITLYFDNGGYGYVDLLTKQCQSVNCDFSYKDLKNTLFDLSHGGPYKFMLTAYGPGASASAQTSLYVDKTPTVNLMSPSGTVSNPFDIIGTATFKPTLDPTKGSITLYFDSGSYGYVNLLTKMCNTENCTFSYKDLKGTLFQASAGGPYKLRLAASGPGITVSDEKTIYVRDCNLKISSFSASSSMVNPSAGDTTNLFWSITDPSGLPTTWTVSVAGRTLTNASWDGKDALGRIVPPGTYTATLTVTNTDGCSDSKPVAITVIAPPKSCRINITM